MPSADFSPAVRLPFDNLSRRSDAEEISWGKLSRLLCTVAGSTLPTLDGYGLRGKLPARPALTPCIRFFVHRLAHLLYASFRPRLATVALAFLLALHLHQVGPGTCTPKLLSMPSTQLSRWAAKWRTSRRPNGRPSSAGRRAQRPDGRLRAGRELLLRSPETF
jgi:hypothetical protein